MSMNEKILSAMATELNCQLADIEKLCNASVITAQAEDGELSSEKAINGRELISLIENEFIEAKIYWYGIISLIKNGFKNTLHPTENLENNINLKTGDYHA